MRTGFSVSSVFSGVSVTVSFDASSAPSVPLCVDQSAVCAVLAAPVYWDYLADQAIALLGQAETALLQSQLAAVKAEQA